jgi:hypothetical protein
MSSSQGLVKVHVLFVRPAEFDSGWEQTDLWRSAAMIPGVDVSVDEQGQEAFRFGSQTSGQTFLYSPQGNLLFSGGITGARGHSGDNDGRSAILSLLTTGKAETPETPVFGCPLGQETLSSQTEKSCDAFHRN